MSRLALGTLPPGEVDRVASHIDRCAACESEMERLDAGGGDALLTHLRSSGAASSLSEDQSPTAVGPGTVLGDYLIEGLIGAGGMGQVFRASHRRMKRDVALKVLSPGMLRSVEAIRRFHREVEVAARLVHPNIAMAYDAGEHLGTHYLILEYINGPDLASLVKERGPQPVARAVDLALQAARGLAHAHRQGIVHRDIKPANLMLDGRGNVKILDLGLSRLQQSDAAPGSAGPAGSGQDSGSADDASNPALTLAPGSARRGSILGTVGYLAPEQAEHPEAADARADVYALGCTLYFLLTGHNPLVLESVARTLAAHRTQPVPPLARYGVRVPRRLEAVVRRMMAKRPADRFESMEDVVAALERFTPAARRQRIRLALGGAIALLLLAVLIGYPAYTRKFSSRGAGGPPHPATATRPAPEAGQVPMDAATARRLQAQWAQCLGVPAETANSLGMRLALIPPGEFSLSIRQRIRLTKPFYIAACEVTVRQFRRFATATGYRTRAEREGAIVAGRDGVQTNVNWQHPEFPQTDDDPVVQMSYEDAAAFCEWLTRQENQPYRLPTEAQWEWAARAGTAADEYWDYKAQSAAAYAWVAENSGGHTHPVGLLKPNAWGLFDMHGNAAEWCSDYYAEWPARVNVEDDVREVLVDPSGPSFGRTRTLRGSAYRSPQSSTGVQARGHFDRSYSGFGFRIVRGVAK
ncbi:MAG TPA: bifunctional serine/threonine-protein kinase/formylglycine-generating enzyme family protein [Tepidisphaeraceae bacterium]